MTDKQQWEELLDFIINHCTKAVKKNDRIKLAQVMLKERGFDFPIKVFRFGEVSFYFLEPFNIHTETIVQTNCTLLILSAPILAGYYVLEQSLLDGDATIKLARL